MTFCVEEVILRISKHINLIHFNERIKMITMKFNLVVVINELDIRKFDIL